MHSRAISLMSCALEMLCNGQLGGLNEKAGGHKPHPTEWPLSDIISTHGHSVTIIRKLVDGFLL
jgi:hypothetical protein